MGMWGAIGSIAGSYFGPVGSMVGGALGSALDGSNSTEDANQAQRQGTDAAVAEQRRQYDLTRSDYAPYREAGTNALKQLQTDINAPVTASDVMSDPGYQFGLTQGQTALDRKIAAMGGRVSGAALKASTRYGTDYASSGYNAAYQRRQDRLNRLSAIAGIGQTGTAGSAAAGTNATNAISGLLSSQGDANAAAKLSQGNIWGNAGNQIAALYGRYGGSGGGGSGYSWSPSSSGLSAGSGSQGWGSGAYFGNEDLGSFL